MEPKFKVGDVVKTPNKQSAPIIYRFFNSDKNKYVYTINENEDTDSIHYIKEAYYWEDEIDLVQNPNKNTQT